MKINFHPTNRILRQFGLLAFLVFAFLAVAAIFGWVVFAFVGEAFRLPLAVVLGAIALFSAVASAVYPAANRPLYVGLSIVAWPIGTTVSFFILLVLFFGVVTPVALVFRILKRDPLNRVLEPNRSSYWEDATTHDDYFKQF
ncbi:MAG: hypothetical protein HN348_01030 [Proteobacteria bacterium]|jgi:hypothetical protein|nr:hypothetical protein [Pseudomonadota bacterium]